MFKKIILLFCLFFSFSSQLIPIPVQAASQFSTSYDINFVFSDNGQARVTWNIVLTNLTDNLYASEYSLKISSTHVSSVTGADGSGAIPVTTNTENNVTTINAKLNQKVVGKNKQVNLTISYTIEALAIKHGRIWDVNLPSVVTNEDVGSYKLTIFIPSSFGKIGKMSPTPSSVTPVSGGVNYLFNSASATKGGVGASFGDYQLFKFTLKYRYKNPNLLTAKATVALPPDTEYQAMYYSSLDPSPEVVTEDPNGNYLATYSVKGGKTLEVIAEGFAKIVDSSPPLQVPKAWTKEELSAFTKSDKFIESNNQQIQKKAKELKNTREIYDFVVSTLKYDFNRLKNDNLGRRGALSALNNPAQSICTDFSDLFVALARAKGIPARGLIGFAYTDDTSLRPTKVEGLVDTTILHAWPEYWDETTKRWIQVDPTWGETTGGIDYFSRLDTNHFAFALYGTSSQFPYPAGAYKLSNNEVDDVKVEVVDEPLTIEPKPTLSLGTDTLIAGFPAVGKLVLQNKSGRALFGGKIALSANRILGLKEDKVINVETLLPFQKDSFDLPLRSSSLVQTSTEVLSVKVTGVNQGQTFKSELGKKIRVAPFFSLGIPQVVLLITFLIVVGSWIAPLLPTRGNFSKGLK